MGPVRPGEQLQVRLEWLFRLQGRWLRYLLMGAADLGAGVLTAKAGYGAIIPFLVFWFTVPLLAALWARRSILVALLASTLYYLGLAYESDFIGGLYRTYTDGVWRIPPSEPQAYAVLLALCWGMALIIGVWVTKARKQLEQASVQPGSLGDI